MFVQGQVSTLSVLDLIGLFNSWSCSLFRHLVRQTATLTVSIGKEFLPAGFRDPCHYPLLRNRHSSSAIPSLELVVYQWKMLFSSLPNLVEARCSGLGATGVLVITFLLHFTLGFFAVSGYRQKTDAYWSLVSWMGGNISLLLCHISP